VEGWKPALNTVDWKEEQRNNVVTSFSWIEKLHVIAG
jgi:hypothetical protein